MDNSEELFHHYVDWLITDCSINVFDKSEFSSYGLFATYIHNLVSGKKTDQVLKLLIPIIDDTQRVFGSSRDEATEFVLLYFINKKWEVYHKPVLMVRGVFGKFLSP